MKYLYIDNIRGIAILMIILKHSAREIEGLSVPLEALSDYGQMGVQLFFIASAFTLCLSRERRINEKYAISNFYIRRFFRVAPLYYAAILLYFCVATVTGQTDSGYGHPIYAPLNVLANLSFLHGFYQPANNNVVPGGWSIAAEVAFYSVFPLIAYLAQRLQTYHKGTIWAMPAIGIAISQAFNLFVLFSPDKALHINNFFYFSIFNQIPVFMLGVALFYSDLSLRPRLNALMFIGLTLLTIGLWLAPIDYLLSVVPFSVGLSFFFLFALFRQLSWMSSKVMGKIGVYSYGMYLTHFLFAWYLPQYLLVPLLADKMLPDALFWLTATLASTLSYVLSQLLYRTAEVPIIRWGKAWIDSREHLL